MADPAPAPRPRAPRMAPVQRREQLLDATLALIAEHGYGAASMEAIARSAGVTKPVVYDAFGDRAALLRALLEREEARAWAALGRAMPSAIGDRPPLRLLVDGLTSFLRAVADDPATWGLILLPAGETPPVVREHVEAGRQVVLEQFTALVAWGLPQLPGLEELDPELAARSMMVVGEAWAQLVLSDPEGHPPERFAPFVERLVASAPISRR